ncbi:hypothetical protein FFLO_00277 [Filobasidium floriforme]|uniref:Uncharacterized protein n=1 Tax=Filobasidium floriforme TaxID=5210 RepID=A0A8K0JSP2_9TREE|nr:uncharacterized protein HD553DRAFT_60984 [Filobasidium floriforme]KAG7575458.1 hypothetical protein FFLO_00277 [Filobasidium floriforme]KAH8082595.1 hypothetical protein HD553DRAFT_60984 [Filobasidium floriforme]
MTKSGTSMLFRLLGWLPIWSSTTVSPFLTFLSSYCHVRWLNDRPGSDENRGKLGKAGYIEALGPVFKKYAVKLVKKQELDEEEFGCLRAIIASLMNISLGSYEPIKTEIVQNNSQILLNLLRITTTHLYIPLGDEQADSILKSKSAAWSELRVARRGLVDWVWKILDECSAMETINETFTSDWFEPLVTSLSGFARQSQSQSRSGNGRISLIADGEEEEDDDPEEILEVETHILGSACTLLDRIVKARTDLLSDLFTPGTTSASNEPPIIVLLDVLENARVPDHWKDLVPEPEQGEIEDVNPDAEGPAQAGFDTDKFMGQAKAVLMKCVVEACAETDLSDREAHAKIWERFGNWMGKGSSSEGDCEGRGDLVGCALLAMGNQVRSDASVRAFAGDTVLFGTFKRLLENEVITDRQVRYAIVGLLRNLVLPDTLKTELGPPAIRAFERWKVFDDEVGIQIMGPLVGGAMVALKLLCRGNLANCLLLTDKASFKSGLMKTIIELGSKTDDFAIKCESSRIFVNILRTLASSQDSQERENVERAQKRMVNGGVVTALVQLVFADNEVLVGEGVMGLVLTTRTENGLYTVAAHVFVEETATKIMDRLQGSTLNGPTTETVDDLLGQPEPRTAPKPLPTEIKSNICVLLVALSTTRAYWNDKGILEDKVWRMIKDGLESLAWAREVVEGDQGWAQAVAQALIAWQS